ncbi:hypothetical protein EDD85DRAFT_496626 [Armillaria nabsnona]|nr:hypothetical protein EDD85DRAFT_496626 [Armillaria nabsnona]
MLIAAGSNQITIIAKAANTPFYALAESYKSHRLFPLSQYDLPSHTPDLLYLKGGTFATPPLIHLRNRLLSPADQL